MDRKNLILFLFFIIFTIIIFTLPKIILAHPGNTSSDGCHFCRTNCNSWGYTYGTRHGHHGEICDPSKGPIDPLYGGKTLVIPAPTIRILPTSTPTPKPIFIPTAIPTPTVTPTSTPTPTLTPTPTEIVAPTPTSTIIPQVEGEATKATHSTFRWWKLTPITYILGLILGWK